MLYTTHLSNAPLPDQLQKLPRSLKTHSKWKQKHGPLLQHYQHTKQPIIIMPGITWWHERKSNYFGIRHVATRSAPSPTRGSTEERITVTFLDCATVIAAAKGYLLRKFMSFWLALDWRGKLNDDAYRKDDTLRERNFDGWTIPCNYVRKLSMPYISELFIGF